MHGALPLASVCRARPAAPPLPLPQTPAGPSKHTHHPHHSTQTILPRPPVQLGIYEAFKVKASALMSATEAAEMILR